MSGHLAFGLLFALPAWLRWNDRRSVGFVILAVVASLVPDIDLWLVAAFPNQVHHHGVTHTVLFVTSASVVGAAIVAGVFTDQLDEWVGTERLDRRQVFLSSFLAFFAGGLSHVFADMLSAPDISTPIEPLWPLVDGSWGIDLVWYNNWWINFGFFAAMVVAHVVAAYALTPPERRRRLSPF
ncbi:metal-dependent hydrolase [Haloarcula sp. CGMCC 1.2071]|uniref:metal-dependent hydrolase n=1 Tax=Haloarcula sp. CGMCC 1.2071 TaxID=3111454 RepID=UPI00300F5F3F